MAFKPTHTIIRTGIDVMFCCVDFTSDLIEVQTEDDERDSAAKCPELRIYRLKLNMQRKQKVS